MSQAANDLNLSFVVDKQQGPRLVSKLHASIIRKKGRIACIRPELGTPVCRRRADGARGGYLVDEKA